jgi:hypothetical protein
VPPSDEDKKVVPGAYNCNIGHFTCAGADLIKTSTTTVNMLHDLASTPDQGFVGDVVAEFPHFIGKEEHEQAQWGAIFGYADDYRQFNFSAWKDADSAHVWYRKNQAHKDIVKHHRTRELRTFSASLAPLLPARPIRYHNRCRVCRHLNIETHHTNGGHGANDGSAHGSSSGSSSSSSGGSSMPTSDGGVGGRETTAVPKCEDCSSPLPRVIWF